jgi:DNA-binding GntR family transcriptional regulator
MLGVQRTSVTAAMGAMQAEGLVHYLRGRVRIVDRPRLEEAACACSRVTRGALARLLR